jgi:prepilin-type processing-associated H-X9-DG protein
MTPFRRVAITIGVIILGMTCLSGPVTFQLLTGWFWYIREILPQVRVNWETLLSATVFTLLFTLGVHWLCRWLYRESGERNVDAPPRRWRLRWSLAGVFLVLLMFAAGTAAVGAVHQVVFLATSEQPMFKSLGWDKKADEIQCTSNLRTIGRALQVYAENNDGRYPDSLRALAASLPEDLSSEVMICPASEWRSHMPMSYIYLGAGLTVPVAPDRIIAYESLANHDGDGMNILFGDGRVEFFAADDAVRLLDAPRHERALTPVSPPR